MRKSQGKSEFWQKIIKTMFGTVKSPIYIVSYIYIYIYILIYIDAYKDASDAMYIYIYIYIHIVKNNYNHTNIYV
jgi:tRNA A37 threonylcarbamoyladenosine biosynthesis protein TsaE